MVPSYMTMPVHVTTKEMIARFTFIIILFCSNLQTFYLIYLYLGVLTTCWHLGLLWAGLLQWCWWFRWLVTLITLLPGWLLMRDSNVSRFWWFWRLVTMITHIHWSTQDTDFFAQPVCGPPACTLQKNVKRRCYNRKGGGHFGCVQQAHFSSH